MKENKRENPYEQMQPREVYPNQEKVEEKIKKHLLTTTLNHPCVDEIRLMGSLAFGRFGVYDEPEHPETKPKYASDVDLLITLDEKHPIPKEWGEEKLFIFFDIYDLGRLSGIEGIKEDVHDIEAWVYDPSQAEEEPRLFPGMEERMEQEQDPRLNMKTRKEWLDYQIQNHETKVWYKKQQGE